MEGVIAGLLQDYEAGKMSRRQLIQTLAMAATAASAGSSLPVAAASVFTAVSVDHISYEVSDYKRTRDFYADLLGMTPTLENAQFSFSQLTFGDSMLVVRNRPTESKVTFASRVDHVAYRIEDWNTERAKAELERRGLKPRLDTGGPAGPPNYASFHIEDPDGFDVQISGTVRPGDSLYKKPGA
jgi:catechol 2,3-dioxygenase-like lactoylglutathione lyase family enzyme